MNLWTDLAERLLDAALTDGGMTVDPLTGGTPSSGYMVGGVVSPLPLPRASRAIAGTAETHAAIAGWLSENYRPGVYVGSWYDVHTGIVWVDLSEHVVDEVLAEDLCRERGELAYYALSANESVYV